MPQLEVISEEMNRNKNLAQPFDCCSSLQRPSVPKGGALVKVCFAGACYSEGHVRRRARQPRMPGFEIAGLIMEVCDSLPNSNFNPGDRVMLYPDEELANSGYTQTLPVQDVNQIMQIPSNVSLEVAAMLPGGALTGYSAILRAKPHVEKLQQVKSCVNVLVVGAGGLGLWTLKLAQYLLGESSSNIKIFVADNNIEKLLTAQDHGCYDVIHWNEEEHEQYIIERTLESCRGGVDVVIDYVSSRRTMQRSLKVLNRTSTETDDSARSPCNEEKEGLIIVGGNSISEVCINLNTLAAKQQSIVGIPKGTSDQLYELVCAVSDGKITPPTYAVFPVEDVNQVFEDLSLSRITGRAVLRFGGTTVDN